MRTLSWDAWNFTVPRAIVKVDSRGGFRANSEQGLVGGARARGGVPLMPNQPDLSLLDALLDSWDRGNTIVVNLLRAIPDGLLEARAVESSPSIGQLFVHIHYCRLVFVAESAPDFARPLPEGEWRSERDRDRLAEMLHDSAAAVREAVRGTLAAGRETQMHFDHPILLLQHLLWHEGYHHGQIKLVLKLAGQPMDDEEIGPLTWDVFLLKRETERVR